MRKTTKMVAVLAAMSVMVLGAATMVSAAEKQGWVKEGSDWYYYNEKEEKLVNAWAQDGAGLWYFLGDDAKMVKSTFVNGKDTLEVEADEIDRADDIAYYYLNADGVMVSNTWVEAKVDDADNKNTPYAGSEDKAWYYFDASGKMYGNAWVLSGSNWYYLGDNGQMLTYTLQDNKYYLKGDGAMVTGWYRATDKDAKNAVDKDGASLGLVEKNWIWAKDNGEIQKAGWKQINSKWYYFGSVTGAAETKNYVMVEDSKITDASGKEFVILSSGAMATGWVKFEDVYYYGHTSKGELTKNKVDRISNKYYYFDETGASFDDGWITETVVGDAKEYSDITDVEPTTVGTHYDLGTLVKKVVKAE